MLLVVALGLLTVLVPYLDHKATGQTSVSTYFVCFGVSAALFVAAAYLFTYRLVMDGNSMRITSVFGERQIAVCDIRDIAVTKTRNGRQVVITLKDSHAIRLGESLNDFELLLSALQAWGRTSDY
jgi:hypothetical protein